MLTLDFHAKGHISNTLAHHRNTQTSQREESLNKSTKKKSQSKICISFSTMISLAPLLSSITPDAYTGRDLWMPDKHKRKQSPKDSAHIYCMFPLPASLSGRVEGGTIHAAKCSLSPAKQFWGCAAHREPFSHTALVLSVSAQRSGGKNCTPVSHAGPL